MYVHHVNNGVFATISSDTVQSIGYFVVSIVLRDVFKFSVEQVRFDNILSLITILPIAASVTTTLYCGMLYLYGSIPLALVSVAAYRSWLGDTVGMIVVIPVAIAIYDVINNAKWRTLKKHEDYIVLSLLVMCLCGSAFLCASALTNIIFFISCFSQ